MIIKINIFNLIFNYFLPFSNYLPIIVIATKWDKVGILIYRSINMNNFGLKSHKCSLGNGKNEQKKFIKNPKEKGFSAFVLNCTKWAIA